MPNAIFSSSASALAIEKTNDFTTIISFVFTDFASNINRQGVPLEEAANIIKTGQYMPIKVRFEDGKPWDHYFATNIGVITSLSLSEDGSKIIATAALWNSEYPEIATYLQSQYTAGKPINFSWELAHTDFTVDDSGIMWLKDITVLASTIVDSPAYGGRTPMLSLAEDYKSAIEGLTRRLETLEFHIREASVQNDNVTADEEVVVESADVDVPATDTSVAQDTTTITKSEYDEFLALRNMKAQMDAEAARAEKLDSRKAASAGIVPDSLFAQYPEFFLTMTDEQFAQYLTVAKEAAGKPAGTQQQQSASVIPEPVVNTNDDGAPTFGDLVQALKTYKSKR